MIRFLVLLLFLCACGKKECSESAEISQLALSTQSYGTIGATIDATITVKDQCPDVQYYAIFTLKKDSAPIDCTDGDSKVAGLAAGWSNLSLSSTYFVRACETRNSYVSTGIVKSVTTNP